MDAAVELCRTVASGLKEPRSSQLSTQRESRPFEGLASMTREEPRNGFTYGFVKRRGVRPPYAWPKAKPYGIARNLLCV